MKIGWYRAKKQYGLASIGSDQNKRSYIARIGRDKDIGCLFNRSALALSLGGNNENVWKIMIYISKGSNIVLKKSFNTEDINEAKELLEKFYTLVKNSDENSSYFKYKDKIRTY